MVFHCRLEVYSIHISVCISINHVRISTKPVIPIYSYQDVHVDRDIQKAKSDYNRSAAQVGCTFRTIHLLYCCHTFVILLLYLCYTFIILLLYFYYTFVLLWLYCCHTFVLLLLSLLPYSCYAVVILLLYFFILLLYFYYTFVILYYTFVVLLLYFYPMIYSSYCFSHLTFPRNGY